MFTVLCLQLKRHVGLKSPHFLVATLNPQEITSVLRSFTTLCINPDSNKPDSDDRYANAQTQSPVCIGVFVVREGSVCVV